MAAAAATVSAVSRALGYAHPAAFSRGLERRPDLLAAFERGRVTCASVNPRGGAARATFNHSPVERSTVKRLLALYALLVILCAVTAHAQLPIHVTGFKQSGGGGGGARSIIFDGVNDYLTNTDTGTAVSSNQVGWKAMFRLRGLASPPTDGWIFYEPSGEVLQLRHSPGGTYGIIQAVIIGSGFHSPSPSWLILPAADCVVLVRSDSASTDISLEVWDSAGGNYAGSRTPSSSSTGTNFQSRSIAIGAATAGVNPFAGKIDRIIFSTGAGSYGGSIPDVLGAPAGDIFDWKFDADSGLDSAGHAPLTLSGAPAFEDTP
jgi:hypothetical protein